MGIANNMIKPYEFFKGSIYHSTEDFAIRCQTRRLTFGYSIYAKKRIPIFSRMRLIWVAYFTQMGGRKRADYYFNKYLERERARAKRYWRELKIINYDDPEHRDLITSVILEKTKLDQVSLETGEKFIN